jgi:hypothetical protein
MNPIYAACSAAFVLLSLSGTWSARAGELMRALPSDARHDAEIVMRYAIAQETCPTQTDLEGARSSVLQLLSETIKHHPAYLASSERERQLLLVQLVKEMKQEAAGAFVFDCSAEGPAARDALIAHLEQRGIDIGQATAGQ